MSSSIIGRALCNDPYKDGLIKSAPNQIDTELDMVPVTPEIKTGKFSEQNKNEVEEIIEELMDKIISKLKKEFKAELR